MEEAGEREVGWERYHQGKGCDWKTDTEFSSFSLLISQSINYIARSNHLSGSSFCPGIYC